MARRRGRDGEGSGPSHPSISCSFSQVFPYGRGSPVVVFGLLASEAAVSADFPRPGTTVSAAGFRTDDGLRWSWVSIKRLHRGFIQSCGVKGSAGLLFFLRRPPSKDGSLVLNIQRNSLSRRLRFSSSTEAVPTSYARRPHKDSPPGFCSRSPCFSWIFRWSGGFICHLWKHCLFQLC